MEHGYELLKACTNFFADFIIFSLLALYLCRLHLSPYRFKKDPVVKKSLKVFVKTYGCQMNERDSEMILSQLQCTGYELTDNEKIADVVILNTCSVREQAEIKALGKSGYLARKKRTNPNFKIGIVGCMAENLGEKLFKLNGAIDFVVGPKRLHELANVIEGNGPNLCIGDPEVRCPTHGFGRKLGKNQCSAFLSIMQGCNMRCSYCIVPKTRGIEQYRPMQDIVEEAKFLAENGIREITLLGQIVNNYGGRLMPMVDGKTPFVQLLEHLNALPWIERIRYMSPHPKNFSDDLILAHKNLPKLCPSVHLPIQSGSDRILAAMKRPYTREKILEIVEKLRSAVPDVGISTDIIVGYPGETEEDFEETVSLFDAVKFNMAFIFKYSPRAGTKSADLIDNVGDGEKERRNQILLQRVQETSSYYHRKFLGKTVEVLIEGHAKRGEDTMFGWTSNHCKVLVKASENNIGRIVPIRIDGFATTILSGTLVDSY
ncbi:MAG: tRNA (N6-isopentenyl adenosine(37)-C2)-methylthiotransferase MiaB [Puniceicoccales bacterium]|jgi:tRNA-2-methylthio-N6-dimethylallyladenosine synthase|nr:tRNA (N6-isopentenyl adenosine(37)-C2)-methylthiotransferase MiaB [Puniceicoccales bacterium]